MRHTRYLNVIMTVIAILLAVVVLELVSRTAPSKLVSQVYAEGVGDWTFIPVGNQEVRRLVIWDKTTNTIYEYNTGGNLENTWKVTAPGQKIQKIN